MFDAHQSQFGLVFSQEVEDVLRRQTKALFEDI
jgi:hypothetical protein